MLDAIELTRRLLRQNTVNPPGHELISCDLIADLFRAHGFEVSLLDFEKRRANLIVRRGRHVAGDKIAAGLRPICFTGHLDTVPLGSTAWSFDPFGAEIHNGRLYGRGSSDMKGGVAAMVAAMIAMGGELDDGPGAVLVLTAGEETGCEGARHLVGHHQLGEVGALVVGEPTGNVPKFGHKGALWLNAETFGQSAHGAMPELGVNAVYRGTNIVGKLQDFGFNVAPHEGLGSPSLSVGRMAGGANINSVPDHTEIGIDIRTLPDMRHDQLIEGLKGFLAPELDRLTPVVDLQGVWTRPDAPWLRELCPLLGYTSGVDGSSGVPFFTDASVLAPAFNGPPVLILGPGETAMAHQTDEYCLTDKITGAVDIYKTILRHWQEMHSHVAIA